MSAISPEKKCVERKTWRGCFCIMGQIVTTYICHVSVCMAMNQYMMVPLYSDSLQPYTNNTALTSGFLISPSETTQLHYTKMECSSMLRYFATGAYFKTMYSLKITVFRIGISYTKAQIRF
jgi:hypothetical protein